MNEREGRCRREQEGAGGYIMVEEAAGRWMRVHEGISACRILKRVREGSGGYGMVRDGAGACRMVEKR